MAMITYYAGCPSCGSDVAAEISVEREQEGGPETEYLPEHWELDTYLHCGCGYEFEPDEEQAVVDDARRYYGT